VSPPPPIAAVIFDYGGVISARFFDNLGDFEDRMGYERGSVHRLMFGDAHSHLGSDPVDGSYDEGPVHDFHLLEMGRLSFGEYLEGLIARAPDVIGKPLDSSAYLTFATTMPVMVQWPMVQRIQRLHDSGMALALLTNNVKEFGNAWRATFPVDELFPIVVDSCEVGLRKPDPRIYELTCAQVGVAPTEAVFLDDNDENVSAAAALGIETVLVGPDSLEAIAELDAILARRGARAGGVRPR
jgi:putative hydrolase of the HAD superfamily